MADDGLPELAGADLLLRLRSLNRALREAVERRAARTDRVQRAGAALYLTDAQTLALIDEIEQRGEGSPVLWSRNADETASLLLLRSRATALGVSLPLDRLAYELDLDRFELGCVVLCAAPEISSDYGRVFGYVVDDLTRVRPSVELALALAGAEGEAAIALRRALAPHSPLLRHRVLEPVGDAVSGLRQELRLVPGVFELLAGAGAAFASVVGDDAAVDVPEHVSLVPSTLGARARILGRSLREGRLGTVGIWGGDEIARRRIVLAVARAAGLPLRRVEARRLAAGADTRRAAADALRTASSLRSLLWVDADAFDPDDPAEAGAASDLTVALMRSDVRICITAPQPWRPAALVAARAYAELELERLTFADRKTLWADALPELDRAAAADLAARFRVAAPEVHAAAALARAQVLVSANGHGVEDVIADAASTVARRRSYRFSTLVRPERAPDDLVLPQGLHDQVLEIAAFFRTGPRLADEWGVARLRPARGLRVLFAGEPGTGKTLAAEVIAGLLGLDLLKVDLSRVLSKWVGESEKNLEAAFDEAEGSASVLFFDEADALFAKRGEIRQGTDRYANLEVGYLLQRLEHFEGLVVLATNLRDNLDDAFTRRFDVIVHFPRPGPDERRAIWSLALPPRIEHELDLDALAQVELTGAAIVASAHTAALLAAGEGAETIAMRHALEATVRQFRREGRVVPPSQLAHADSLDR